MNSVISLIKQNMLSIMGLKRNLLIIVVFSFGYPLMFPEFLLFTSVMIPFMLLFNMFSMEEKNKNEYLISMLPIKKESYIIARYVLVMLIVIANLLISLLMNYIISLGIGLNNPVGYDPMFITLVCITAPVVLASIGIPIITKIGAVKGQIVVMVSLAAIAASVGASGALFGVSIPELGESTFVILVVGICLISILVSYFIYLNIYNKKEVR